MGGCIHFGTKTRAMSNYYSYFAHLEINYSLYFSLSSAHFTFPFFLFDRKFRDEIKKR